MDKESYLEAFRKEFPYASDLGIRRLFHYRRTEGVSDDRLESFFVDAKLYHSAVADLNDPFEARPHYNGPQSKVERDQVLTNFFKTTVGQGYSSDTAVCGIIRLLNEPERITNSVHAAALEAFSLVRMHSFTMSNSNLLMWSHYADSHKGLCVEFDATVIPICGARKVRYQVEYPTLSFPLPENDLGHRVTLTKSSHWDYENEFRSLHTPEAGNVLPSEGNFLLLPPEAVTAVYFGAGMKSSQKNRVLSMIERGPFEPQIYDSQLSASRFEVKFVPRSKK